MDYLLAQSLSLVFYIITLVVYSRARKEYVGGKIAAAIKLIMIFMVILFCADFVDYFFVLLFPLNLDSILIFKILLKLIAICTLFFGGLKFFVSRPADAGLRHGTEHLKEIDADPREPAADTAELRADATIVLEDVASTLPSLGRYEILGQISRGAMGIVYKGRDPKLNRLTAIKTIRFSDEFDEDQVETVKEQFYREAEVVAKLSHPHIVTIYDMGEDFDLSYIAMEYLEGDTLKKYTKEENLLPVEHCIQVVKQVCDALEYAHSRGIVHRDIKPANIMLLKDGHIKVADFGIARVAASTKTQTGIIKGTPYYMSPEQAKGKRVDGPSDIFSLGVVFYQLLTGQLPFKGPNMASIMYQITAEDPKPPTDYNPKLSRKVVSIIKRALEKTLKKRYQTAEQMGDDLHLVLQSMDADPELKGEEIMTFEDGDLHPEAAEISGVPEADDEPEHEKDLDFSDLDHILDMEKSHGIDIQPEVEAPDFGPDALQDQDDELDFTDLEQGVSLDSEPEIARDLEPDRMDFISKIDETPDVDVSETGRPQDDESVRSDLTPLTEGDAVEEGEVEILKLKPPTFGYPETFRDDVEERAAGYLSTEVTPSLDDWKKIIFDKEARPAALTRFFRLLTLFGILIFVLWGVYYYSSWKTSRKDQQLAKQLRQSHLERQKKRKDQKEKKPEQKQTATQQLADVKKLPPAVREQLAEIEIKEQAQRERRAKIEKEEQAQRERRAIIEKEKQAQRERQALIEKEKQAQRKRRAKIEKAKREALKQNHIRNLDELIAQAENAISLKQYPEAKNKYETALKIIIDSDFREDETVSKHKTAIEKALKSDDIVYGAKGYLQYKNKWIHPDEYEKNLYREGYVKYKGRFKHYTDLKSVIKKITYPSVQSFLTSKYSGQSIHKKLIKISELELRQNTGQSAHFTAVYKWEVWTFSEIGEGRCSLDAAYDVEKDTWQIMRGCK
jgi:serine/threonine protein kinase